MNWRRIGIGVVVAVVVVAVQVYRFRKGATLPFPSKTYFAEGTNPTAADVIALYRKLGYGSVADSLETKAAPCVRLIPDKSAGDPLSSRIGGKPGLPDAGLWPKYKGKSMAFIAQLNLDEITERGKSDSLPAGGLLYVFYDAEQFTGGYDPKDKGSWAVIYGDKVSDATSPTDYPPDLPEEARYKSVPVKLQSELSVPDPSDMLSDLSLSEKQRYEVIDIYGQFSEQGGPLHQLLGHPVPIQGNDMELECQLASHGVYVGDPKGYKDPRVKGLKAGASQWRLLLQIDSDDEAEMMWGDAGRLYFWITQDDLKNKRFENVWMISQCY
jgi:uncharacterized protein YwqG